MIDLMDFDKIAILLIQNDLYDLFLYMEVNQNFEGLGHTGASTNLIASMFKAALKLDEMTLAMHIITNFEAHLLQKSDEVIPELIW